MSEKCYRCGTIYDGWSCPMCSLKREMKEAQDDASIAQEAMHERELEAIEGAREDIRMEMQDAAARQKGAIAQSWRLQAEAKVKRAYELYKADLYQDAVKLCMDAMSQDPGNIAAYRVAAWAYARMGQSGEARDLLDKQIKLLKTSDYKNSRVHALKVLQDVLRMQDNRALISAFLDMSEHFGDDNAPGVRLRNRGHSSLDLVDELMKPAMYKEARQLFMNTTTNGTLLARTYEVELDIQTTGKADPGKLAKYLKGLAATDRQGVFEEFERIAGGGKFSESALDFVRTQILQRYEEWKPEIERELVTSATDSAEHEASKGRGPIIVGWAIGVAVSLGILFFPAWYYAGRGYVIPLPPWYSWGLHIVAVVATFLLCGILIPRAIRGSRRYEAKPRILASLRKSEEELRQSIDTARTT